jgi:RNA polymerase sigma factor (sigma-70 family)
MQAALQSHESESAIIKRHARLIRFVALPFANRGVALDDLVQEGRIALLDAARRWRASEGVRLWTYARKFVLGAMVRFGSKESCEPCRRHTEDDDAIAERMSSGETPEEALLIAQCSAIAAHELTFLNEVERRVLRHRFVDGLDIRTIGQRLDLSKSEADRIYHGAIRTLRERVGALA